MSAEPVEQFNIHDAKTNLSRMFCRRAWHPGAAPGPRGYLVATGIWCSRPGIRAGPVAGPAAQTCPKWTDRVRSTARPGSRAAPSGWGWAFTALISASIVEELAYRGLSIAVGRALGLSVTVALFSGACCSVWRTCTRVAPGMVGTGVLGYVLGFRIAAPVTAELASVPT